VAGSGYCINYGTGALITTVKVLYNSGPRSHVKPQLVLVFLMMKLFLGVSQDFFVSRHYFGQNFNKNKNRSL